jgi:hypothetical protein
MTHKVSPASVDYVKFTFSLDPANNLEPNLVYRVVPPFLFYMANKVSPAPVNVVIAALLLDMPNELNQTVVDTTTCPFFHPNLAVPPTPGAKPGNFLLL